MESENYSFRAPPGSQVKKPCVMSRNSPPPIKNQVLTLFIKNLGNISANNVVQAVKYLNKDICQLLDINLSLMKEPTLPLGYKKGFSSSDSKKISNSKKIDYFLRFEGKDMNLKHKNEEMSK
jgi:hypothetical protein